MVADILQNIFILLHKTDGKVKYLKLSFVYLYTLKVTK